MIEERIKELARKTPFGWTQEHTETTKQLIRTVAAEAREEGIEEIKSKLREHAKWKLHAIASTGEWREGYKAAIEWVISNVEYAERLKEKGK